jgi:cell division protein ZipA
MDKELLRVVIVLLGVLVMIGMLLWHFFKSMRERRETDYFDETSYDDLEDEEFSLGHSDFSPSSVVDGDALLDEEEIKPVPQTDAYRQSKTEMPKPVPRHELPKLIEFSLVARADQGFNGEELFDAFDHLHLEYGSVKVFERVDKQRMVHFTVASMIEPGIFPETDLENFYCPGIVFFMQPREVVSPLAVFDDFIETIDLLAEDLDGVVWDNQKQPLTAETIAYFRDLLAQK